MPGHAHGTVGEKKCRRTHALECQGALVLVDGNALGILNEEQFHLLFAAGVPAAGAIPGNPAIREMSTAIKTVVFNRSRVIIGISFFIQVVY